LDTAQQVCGTRQIMYLSRRQAQVDDGVWLTDPHMRPQPIESLFGDFIVAEGGPLWENSTAISPGEPAD
jgi:hypothetical protein